MPKVDGKQFSYSKAGVKAAKKAAAKKDASKKGAKKKSDVSVGSGKNGMYW